MIEIKFDNIFDLLKLCESADARIRCDAICELQEACHQIQKAFDNDERIKAVTRLGPRTFNRKELAEYWNRLIESDVSATSIKKYFSDFLLLSTVKQMNV